MTGKEQFVQWVNVVKKEYEMPDEAWEYLEKVLRNGDGRKDLSENAVMILEYLQQIGKQTKFAKEIAEDTGLNAKSVPGLMRKLVSEEYVEVIAQKPNSYMITDKGLEYKGE